MRDGKEIRNSIIKAVTAARIFINREKELTEADYKYLGIVGTKRTSALRRASMELTRALSEMRRS
jgi:hypothetical protein